MLTHKWLEGIAQAIESEVGTAGPLLEGRDVRQPQGTILAQSGGLKAKELLTLKKPVKRLKQIPPRLMRLFTLCNIYLERRLFLKMQESLESYLRFLLSFVARCPEVTAKRDFTVLGLG